MQEYQMIEWSNLGEALVVKGLPEDILPVDAKTLSLD
jgi:hypothetical protein